MPKVTMPKDHPQAAVELPNGAVVERGKSAEVDDETACSLEEQGWTVAQKSAANKAAAKPASSGADPKES